VRPMWYLPPAQVLEIWHAPRSPGGPSSRLSNPKTALESCICWSPAVPAFATDFA